MPWGVFAQSELNAGGGSYRLQQPESVEQHYAIVFISVDLSEVLNNATLLAWSEE